MKVPLGRIRIQCGFSRDGSRDLVLLVSRPPLVRSVLGDARRAAVERGEYLLITAKRGV
jgi:hypothetical protein